MTKFVNRAKMTTATTGTGTITLGSAVEGYQTFSAAGLVDTDVVRYTIEDGNNWEVGTGTYSSGTLTRTPIESSSAGSAINLSGDAVVFVTASGKDVLTATQVVTLSDGTIDLTKGNYFELETDQNTTYSFSNPETVEKFTIRQTTNAAVVNNPYDVVALSYNGVSFTGLDSPPDFVSNEYSADGAYLYRANLDWSNIPNASIRIVQHTLSGGNFYPTSTSSQSITLMTSSTVTGTVGSVFGSNSVGYGTSVSLKINSTGTKMLVSVPFSWVDITYTNYYFTLGVYEISLSTAYDISTASIVDYFEPYTANASVHQSAYLGSMLVEDDGTSIYWLNTSGGSAYALSTGFDLSTRGTVDQTGTYTGQTIVTATRGPNSDLYVGYFLNGSSPYVFGRLTVTDGSWNDATDSGDTPFDLSVVDSSASYGKPVFYDSGNNLAVVGSDNATIYHLSTAQSTVPTIAFPANIAWLDGVPDAPLDGKTVSLDFVTIDGGVSYLGKSNKEILSPSSMNIVTFTSSNTYNAPSNLLYAEISVTGAGGGGGGADNLDTSSGSAGGGGGAGGTVIAVLNKEEIGSSVQVTIGSGGSGGGVTGTSGSVGGYSQFASAIGALVGYGGSGGVGSATSTVYMGAGGSGGGSSTGGITSAFGVNGGYGLSGFVGDQTTYFVRGGDGGSSIFGNGGRGSTALSGPTNGVASSVFGAGGGGGVTSTNTFGATGGLGSSGVVVIKEYLA